MLPGPRLRFGVLLCLLGALPASGLAGEQEKERFENEYPRAARALADRLSHVQGTATVVLRPPQGDPRFESVTFAVDGANRKAETEYRKAEDGPVIRERVDCTGPDGSFVLHRPEGQSEFQLQSINGASPDSPGPFATGFGKLLDAPFSCSGGSFAEFLRNGHGRLISVEPAGPDEGPGLVVVMETGKPEQPVQLTFLVDPDLGWAARRCTLVPPGRPQPAVEYEIEYDGAPDGPWPRAVRFLEGGAVWECRFDSISPASTDRDAFTLEHYGISKPKLATSGRGRFRLWYLGALAVVVVLAAVGVRAAVRR